MSVTLVVFYILITGGLHLDALMDTSDAHFSRRPRERKLEIMKDSRVGAFAVVSLFVLLSMKIGVFHQLLDTNVLSINLCFIPLISRTIQPLFLYHAPYAAEEGLAKMYGDLLIKKEQVILWLILALTLVVGYYLIQYDILVLIITSLLTYVLYYRFAMKEFNGITGDIIGAYIEIVEVLMLLSLVVFR
jgi:adenosylcobinamide-GDP ribazoletransferase